MSIRRMGQGWQVRVKDYPTRTFPRKKDAEAYELDCKRRRALGQLFEEAPATFGDELDGWFEHRRVTRRWAVKTVQFYAHARRGLEPLRDIPLDRLSPLDVEDHIAGRAAEAPRSAKSELEVVKAVLVRAQRRGQRVDARILALDPVKVTTREGVALTVPETEELAAYAGEHVRRLILLAGSAGFRINELFTLTDSRVDLEAGTVTIPRDLNKSRVLKVVEITPDERRLLREQLLARTPNMGGIVFPTTYGNVWTHNSFRRNVWEPACKAAGRVETCDQRGCDPPCRVGAHITLHVHDLRHTAISLMCAAGFRPEWVAERVGHSDGGALILKRYRHLYRGEMHTALGRLDEYVRGQRDIQPVSNAGAPRGSTG